jgi:hypothetical protein
MKDCKVPLFLKSSVKIFSLCKHTATGIWAQQARWPALVLAALSRGLEAQRLTAPGRNFDTYLCSCISKLLHRLNSIAIIPGDFNSSATNIKLYSSLPYIPCVLGQLVSNPFDLVIREGLAVNNK